MYESLIERVIQAGANKAAVIPVSELAFDPHLRSYCEANQCGKYGTNYGCPPFVGTAEEMMEKAQSYEHALFFQTISALEDSYDIEGMAEAGARHNQLSLRLFDQLREELPGCLAMAAGGCTYCKTCAKADDEPCRFPDKAVFSMSGFCLNVSQCAAKCGMKYTNGVNTVTYFSAVLF